VDEFESEALKLGQTDESETQPSPAA
jgi:hypothetical protein